MAVEVDHADGAIGPVDTPEERKSDRVITTQGNDSRQCPSCLRRAFLAWVSGRGAIENTIVAVFDLLNRVGIIITPDGR